ncbi:CI protein [Bordetella phage vB_BbrS_PHB09]|uniref:XRE family transcriptional regulator n=2 Tax=Bordetella bronchiseptica TaxID=518 RepID=UPI00067C95F6|nr:XRE family transcriptional regulator [Bordetella bronchiseptica]QEA10871.1 CI protein [Bordetella phage vB_BbrS_PHB09]QET71418.1 helix-turn-helix transcriptional regulator [Bordetella bronchiseptica]
MAMGRNIRLLRTAKGLTHDALGELAGTSGQTISQLEQRDSKRSMYASAIAKAFKLTVEEISDAELRTLDDALRLLEDAARRAHEISAPTDTHRHLAAEPAPEYVGRPAPARLLPVVGMAQLGENGYYEELAYPDGHGDGYILHASTDPEAYVLRVRGDSMKPAIRNGWYVVVEPNSEVEPGEYVALQLADGRKMVKELIVRRRGGDIEVLSVNGEVRMSLHADQVERLHAIGAIVPPSKHRTA